jgi:hypothetical protein
MTRMSSPIRRRTSVSVLESRFFVAEGHDLVRQRRGARGGRVDFVQQGLGLRAGLKLVMQEIGVAEDDGQEVIEVVRDAARQTAERLHFLGVQVVLLETFGIGEIVSDDDGADELAFPIAQRRRGQADVDAPAILMDQRGFGDGDLLAPAEPVHRLAVLGLVLLRDQPGAGLAEHLGPIVAEELASARVPIEDDVVEGLGDDGMFRVHVRTLQGCDRQTCRSVSGDFFCS